MRDINFQEVGMENFGPYIEPMIHTFTNDTLTLMTGPNGIGKTMSLDAIPFTLFGITSKGAKGDDVVNNVVGKNCKTWVKFKIDDTQCLVTRYQKYKKYGNTVVLNINGVDTKSGHREVVPEIERMICSSKSFMNTLMFGQKVKDFFTDLVDSDKKQIFRMILALERYLSYYKETDKNLKDVNNSINEIQTDIKIRHARLNDAVEQVKYLQSLEKQFYKEQKRKVEELTKSIEENERLLKKWIDHLKELEACDTVNTQTISDELAKMTNEIDNLSNKYQLIINDLKSQSENKKYEIKQSADAAEKKIIEETSNKIQEIDDKIKTITEQLTNELQKHQSEKHKNSETQLTLDMNNDSHRSRIEEINDNVLGKDFSLCPTCEQTVDEKTRDNLLEKVKKHEKEIASNNEKIEALKSEHAKMIKNISKISDELNEQISGLQKQKNNISVKSQAERIKINERLDSAFSQVDELTKQKLKEINIESQNEKESLVKRRNELNELKESSKEHEEELTKAENIIEDLNNKISLLKSNIKDEEDQEYDLDQLLKAQQREYELKNQIKQFNTDIETYIRRQKILEFWKSAFSSTGIPSMLIDESIPFMNKQVCEYLDMLTNGRYVVSFDTLAETKAGAFRDKISVRVLDTHTQANSRVQLSGGQTRIIDIATILTLGDLQSNIQDIRINILLFDEIFDALDEENIGYVAKVLNKLKIGKSIYIISHQHQDQVEADQTLTLS